MKHFIDGNEVESINSKLEWMDVENPTTLQVIGNVPLNDVANATYAVESAKLALPLWKALPVHKRVDVLIRWYCWLQDNKKVIADVVSTENGKTVNDALSEVERGIEVVQFSLSAPAYLKGECAAINTNLDIHTRKESLGVVCGIAPFNFPAMIPCWMVPIALACGNTFVLKASELVPSCAVLLAKGAIEAGIPPGVFNVVQGGKEVVEYLCTEPSIKAVTFVGSTRVGRVIEKLAVGKRLQLNMGAKNHAVVMPDADYESASDAIVGAAFGGCGQRCMALSVVITVGDSDEFDNMLAEKTKRLLPSVDTGPLVCSAAKKRIVALVDEAVEQGAELATPWFSTDGNYLTPTIIKNVNTEMKVYQQELFGPVVCHINANSLDDAINIINANPYGNGCAIFTTETAHAVEFEKKIEVGQVGVNVPIPVPPPYFSWTSTKDSFTGSHHIYGPETFDFYTQTRTTMSRSVNKTTGVQTSMPV